MGVSGRRGPMCSTPTSRRARRPAGVDNKSQVLGCCRARVAARQRKVDAGVLVAAVGNLIYRVTGMLVVGICVGVVSRVASSVFAGRRGMQHVYVVCPAVDVVPGLGTWGCLL
jgi:hypothetical protein